MCGLAGLIQADPSDGSLKDRAIAMRSRLRHRGPDDEGLYIDPRGHCAMVHTRLAILDLSPAGHQPMISVDGRLTIVFNGEIYNFQSLRSKLRDGGKECRSNSDTEVLLHLYQQYGADCLTYLEGMFAFAIWDSSEQTCFLARDPLGIKPLYFWHLGNRLGFASEIRSLLQANLGPRRLSTAGLTEYLLYGSVQEPGTLVDGIEMLPAGHCAVWDGKAGLGQPVVKRYWSIPWGDSSDSVTSQEEAAELTREALNESVRRHLVSDVPVGMFLSGGIDSTALVALTRANTQANIKTFCIGFEETEFDEGELAARTAEHFSTDHHRWTMTPSEGVKLVEEFLDQIDQPSNDGFNTYCVSKFAREQGLKVVLSGLGGDELFGGYPSFERVPELVRWGRFVGWIGPFRKYVSAFGQASLLPPKIRRLACFAGTSMGHSGAYWTTRGFFTARDVARLTHAYTDSELSGSILSLIDDPIPQMPSEKDIVSYLELTRYMRNQLLRDSDVMSMAHSLELRVPLVDRKLVDSLRRVPSQFRHAPGKRLLLDAVPEIPDWIATQPKQGFRFPFDQWISSQWGHMFRSIDEWSPVPLAQWYHRWALLTLNHFLRENQIEVAGRLP